MNSKLTAAVSAAALVLGLTAGTAAAEKKVLLKVPVFFGTHLTGLGSTPKWLSEHMQTATDGNIKIKIYEPGKLIPPEEILQAVSEFSMPAIDKRLGFHKILKFNYYPGWHQPATAFDLIVNSDTWGKMTPGQQETLELGCKAAMLDALALGEAIQFPIMKENLEKNGVENRYWSEEMLDMFREKWAEVVAEQSAEDPEFKVIWDNLQAFRADYAIWNEWAFLPRPGTVRKPSE